MHHVPTWKDTLYRIIFEHDTPGGRRFDVALIVAILVSVLAVILDSVQTIHARYGSLLYSIEWVFTILFSVEYLLRLSCARNAGRYAMSFFGLVDLLAFLPTYVSIVVPGSQAFLVIRILRILRVFRVLKLVEYLGEPAQRGVVLCEPRWRIRGRAGC